MYDAGLMEPGFTECARPAARGLGSRGTIARMAEKREKLLALPGALPTLRAAFGVGPVGLVLGKGVWWFDKG